MTKRKQNDKIIFWLLVAFFGLMSLASLLFLWSLSPLQSVDTPMMGSTMGDSARKDVGNIGFSDLFKPGEFVKSDMSSHHQGDSLIAKAHFATTVIVVVTLPIIIGGLALLLVLWI